MSIGRSCCFVSFSCRWRSRRCFFPVLDVKLRQHRVSFLQLTIGQTGYHCLDLVSDVRQMAVVGLLYFSVHLDIVERL